MSELSQEQRQVVSYWRNGISLTAAAGSGKTTTLVAFYLHLLEQGLTPSQILTATFTNEAAAQLRERIYRALELRGSNKTLLQAVEATPYIGTLHSFCRTIINQYGDVIGLVPVEYILNEADAAILVERDYHEWRESLSHEDFRRLLHYLSPPELKSLFRYFWEHRLQLSLVSEREVVEPFGSVLETLQKSLGHTYLKQDSELIRRGVYRFDDLERLTIELLTKSQESRERISSQFKKVLLDEFQDTSRAQWKYLSALFGETPNKIFFVGDPKQSIYRFRNADVALFSEVRDELEKQGGVSLELNTNYRTSPPVLQSINSISRQLFVDSAIEFHDMQAGRESSEDHIPPTLITLSSNEDEASVVARMVQSQIQSGATPSDIALLFRVSDKISRYADAIENLGIATTYRSALRPFETYASLDLFSFLSALSDPYDNWALSGFLCSRWVGVSQDKWLEWVSTKDSGVLFESLATMNPPELNWFFRLIDSGELRLDRAIESLFLHSHADQIDVDFYTTLLSPLIGRGLTIIEANERLRSWRSAEIGIAVPTDAPRDAVRLLTVHGAKGLEFAHVHLVDNARLPNRFIPTILSTRDGKLGIRLKLDLEPVASPVHLAAQEERKLAEFDESKRLLYVALTRSRDSLTIYVPSPGAPRTKGTWVDFLS